MKIENHFGLPIAPAAAWPILMDVPRTAACFPGAGDVEQAGENQYKGRVTVKLGPLAMLFAGTLYIQERDNEAHRGTVKAAWSETKGRGNANTVTQFALQPDGEGTRVTMTTDLQLAGQVAQYGRGTGMISAISAQLISTFAATLRGRIEAANAGVASAPQAQAMPEISGLTLIAKALGSQLKRTPGK